MFGAVKCLNVLIVTLLCVRFLISIVCGDGMCLSMVPLDVWDKLGVLTWSVP